MSGLTALDILAPLLTERVRALALERLTGGGNLFNGDTLSAGITKSDAKLALLLVRHLNPLEHLSKPEEALLRGVARGTLRKIEVVNC